MKYFVDISLIAILLSACVPSRNATDTASPKVYCQGHMAWSAEIVTGNMISYTTFWIAFEQAPVMENFQYLTVAVTLDGQPVVNGFEYLQSPEPFTVTCTDGMDQFESNRVQYTLLLPLLVEGEHKIVWKYTLTADLSDELFNYPAGMTDEITGTMSMR